MDADQEELDANCANHTNQDLQTAENAEVAENKTLHFVNSISTQCSGEPKQPTISQIRLRQRTFAADFR
jgi:hypothetical protein